MQELTITTNSEAENVLRQAMREAGIVTSYPIISDGQLHRFHIEGDKQGSENGWYVLFDDEVPAGAFGCWKRNIHEKWCSIKKKLLSPKKRDRVNKQFQETKILRDKEQAKVHAEAQKRAGEIWNNASEIQNHLYLENKGVKAYGIRENRDSLIVPVQNSAGNLSSLQFIIPDGTKKFLCGGKKKGCFHLIGMPDRILYITEGYATGASIHEATGEAVAVAFDIGNLKPVAESLKQKYQDVSIVVASDNDAHTKGNPGLTKAKEAALSVGGKVAVPVFDDTIGNPTDFNDLWRLGGNKKVKEFLDKAYKPKPSLETINAKIAELAKLDLVEYELQRKPTAVQLGLRDSILDKEVEKLRPKSDNTKPESGRKLVFEEVEPWPEPVNGDILLSNLVSSILRHAILPNGGEYVIPLWAICTYLHEAFDIFPKLAITSPLMRCGKTTVLEWLQNVVCKPLPTSNITTAALFRSIELWKPTLIIDEADTFIKKGDEIQGIINSGHRKSSAFVIRTVGDEHEPRKFSTFAPQVIALIGKMKNTLADRSIKIPMVRKLTGDRVKRMRGTEAEFLEFRRKLTRWTQDLDMEVLRTIEPEIPEELNDRARDNSEPLLAIAEIIGGDWPQKTKEAIRVLTRDEAEDDSWGVDLLKDIKDIFEERGTDRIFTKDLIETLKDIEERPWSDFRKGKPISVRQLASLLRPFGILSQTLRIGDQNLKGYKKTSYLDAFRRYIPNGAVTTSHRTNEADLSPSGNVTTKPNVTAENRPQAGIDAGCDVVTAKNQELWEKAI